MWNKTVFSTAILVLGAAVFGGRVCRADTKFHALVIGNNIGLVAAGEAPLPALRFADDDAAAFFDLVGPIAGTSRLLTVMDAETQAENPRLAAIARPPTLRQLRAAIEDLSASLEQDKRAGDRTVLFIFFSGHGTLDAAGAGPALALLDGGITQRILYDEILAKLPADSVHLLVDACHAEAVVRPRDANATVARVAAADAGAFLARTTLARFPQVGAIVAAASDAQSHEWDVLRRGVFTHELLSGLRGAADVNRDGRLEYSEIYAFLAAANHGIADPRARLTVVARPPDLDRRAALLDRAWFPPGRISRLIDVPARGGTVEVEDGSGRRVASLHSEPGFVADLMVPAGDSVFVRAEDREARFEASEGGAVSFAELDFATPTTRPRGPTEDAMRRGLFAREFGRRYYSGVVDQASELTSVTFPSPGDTMADVALRTPAPDRRVDPAWRVLVGAGASTAVASAFDVTESVRVGLRPDGARGGLLSLDLFRAGRAGLTEWRATASAGWLRAARLGVVRAWAGAVAGGGAIGQVADGRDTRWSGLLVAGPEIGLNAVLGREVGIWAEAEAGAIAYRRDGRSVVSFAPAAWVGVSFGL